MDNNILISIIVKSTPIIVSSYIVGVLFYKIYVRVRFTCIYKCIKNYNDIVYSTKYWRVNELSINSSKYNANVNCWFCNQNAKVPYLESNSWTCPHCEQYNGFNRDGDYNRELIQQKDCSNISTSKSDYVDNFSDLLSPRPLQNGFCDACNEAQRLKVEKLAQFEPKKQSNYDAELKLYKEKLEEQYRLCATCDRHLNKVLREKKKMVLGSKFLNFIIKGAETIKEPHFKHIRYVYLQKWKNRFSVMITILAIINLYCLSSTLPTITRDVFINILGEEFGRRVFSMVSAVLAFIRVITSYLDEFAMHHLTIKTGLFLRTIFLMLLYSLGLKLPHEVRCNFIPLYLMACPFAILSLAFGYNLMDKFKLTRFSFLMVIWSLFAGGLVGDQLAVPPSVLMTLASLLTCLLSVTRPSENSTKLLDISKRRYHKIYSEDYFSDDETMSMLSEQLNQSFCSHSAHKLHLAGSLQTKSPITSSTFSLNNIPREQLTPNDSFQSFNITNTLHRREYPSSFHCCTNGVKGRSALNRSTVNTFGSNGNINKHNSSFSFGEFKNPYDAPEHSNENLYSPTMTNGLNGFGSVHSVFKANHKNNSSLYSPLSLSTSDVYQQRKANLLTPSRFDMNYMSPSWYSNRLYHSEKSPYINRRLLDHRSSGMQQNLSRASSQSSGFESQNGPVNRSRENSAGHEPADLLLRTVASENDRSFLPIQANNKNNTNNFADSTSLSQPLTVNCSLSATKPSTDIWKRKSIFERDTFNLRKINEELPTIQRGDLLRSWQQNQGIA